MKSTLLVTLSLLATQVFAQGGTSREIQILGDQATIIREALSQLENKSSSLVLSDQNNLVMNPDVANLICDRNSVEASCLLTTGHARGLPAKLKGEEAEVLYTMMTKLYETQNDWTSWILGDERMVKNGMFGGGPGGGHLVWENNIQLVEDFGNLNCRKLTESNTGLPDVISYSCSGL